VLPGHEAASLLIEKKLLLFGKNTPLFQHFSKIPVFLAFLCNNFYFKEAIFMNFNWIFSQNTFERLLLLLT
jgi:hypothetical protein